MNGAEILALITGLPAIIGAITALIWALRGKQTANEAHYMASRAIGQLNYHVAQKHNEWPPAPKSMS